MVDELPYANPLQMAKQLLKSISLLNRHPGGVANRADLMACFHTPFHQLVNSAKQKNRTSTHRDAAELYAMAEKIAIEMSYGYKIGIREQHYFQKGRLSAQQQAALIYHALDSLILSLLFSFAEHRQEPLHLWSEIIQLYLLAEVQGVSKEAVSDPQHQAESSPTIRAQFKSITLIFLLDPFKLQQNEIWQVYNYLAWWGGLALITTFQKMGNSTGGRFVIGLEGHKKPHAYTPETPPKNPQYCLLLNSTPLCAQITRQLQSIGTTKTPSISGLKNLNSVAIQQLFRNMLVAWHLQPKRHHPRQERYDWLVIASGVTDIVHFLKHGGVINTSTPENGVDEEMVTISDSLTPSQTVAHNTFRWRQTNISKSGICLEIDPGNFRDFQVGQLLLMESERAEGRGNWIIGVIRRFIYRNKNTLEVGIQFIQGGFTPATIKPVVFGTTKAADFQPAILLDRGDKHPPPSSPPNCLITRSGSILLMRENI